MLRALFSGRGRLDRLGYLLALLAAGMLFCIPPALILARPHGSAAPSPALMAAGTVVWGLSLWIYCAATARRLHDMDRSGWLAVLGLLPAIGLGALTLVLLGSRGTAGPNRYGERWL